MQTSRRKTPYSPGVSTSWTQRRGRVLVFHAPDAYSYQELDGALRDLVDQCADAVRGDPDARIAVLWDVTRVRRSEARNRKRIADALGEMTELLPTHCIGFGVVVRSQVIRAAITGILWLRPLPWPVKTFLERHEADEWLEAELGP